MVAKVTKKYRGKGYGKLILLNSDLKPSIIIFAVRKKIAKP